MTQEARFDVVLHPLPGLAVPGESLADSRGTWPTIVLPAPGATFAVAFGPLATEVSGSFDIAVDNGGTVVFDTTLQGAQVQGDLQWGCSR
mgnify:CR=1 FL=1